MDKARYLVEAHVREGRSVAELAAQHGVVIRQLTLDPTRNYQPLGRT